MGKNGSNTGQIVTSWSLEKKNVDLDDVGGFSWHRAQASPISERFFFFFPLTPLEIYRNAFKFCGSPEMDGGFS